MNREGTNDKYFQTLDTNNSLWQGAGQSSSKALARLLIKFHKGKFFIRSEDEVLSPGKEFSFNIRTLCQTIWGVTVVLR
jgi:hypothetical protein